MSPDQPNTLLKGREVSGKARGVGFAAWEVVLFLYTLLLALHALTGVVRATGCRERKGVSRTLFYYSLPLTSSRKDQVRQEPSWESGGEVISSKVRGGGSISSSLFTWARKPQAQPAAGPAFSCLISIFFLLCIQLPAHSSRHQIPTLSRV